MLHDTSQTRLNIWKTPVLKKLDGSYYTRYKKISLAELEKHLKECMKDYGEHQSGNIDPSEALTLIHKPYLDNAILYIIDKWQKLHEGNENATFLQKDLISEINNTFGKFGIKALQGSVSKALQNLSKPFCYGTSDELHLVVFKDKRYSIVSYQHGLKGTLNHQLAKLKKFVISDRPFIFAGASIKGTSKKRIKRPTGFIYRIKPLYINEVKKILLAVFDSNTFFNIIIYEDNLIILLNSKHKDFIENSSIIKTMFSNEQA